MLVGLFPCHPQRPCCNTFATVFDSRHGWLPSLLGPRDRPLPKGRTGMWSDTSSVRPAASRHRCSALYTIDLPVPGVHQCTKTRRIAEGYILLFLGWSKNNALEHVRKLSTVLRRVAVLGRGAHKYLHKYKTASIIVQYSSRHNGGI